jgi:glycosyltransferase involved in cell wall biosynthesis
LLDDPDRDAMGGRARDYVLNRYNWDGITDDTLAVYSRALGK